jgi:RNA polymerase-interacting CarD/CdnL/TRCF family regulator
MINCLNEKWAGLTVDYQIPCTSASDTSLRNVAERSYIDTELRRCIQHSKLERGKEARELQGHYTDLSHQTIVLSY